MIEPATLFDTIILIDTRDCCPCEEKSPGLTATAVPYADDDGGFVLVASVDGSAVEMGTWPWECGDDPVPPGPGLFDGVSVISVVAALMGGGVEVLLSSSSLCLSLLAFLMAALWSRVAPLCSGLLVTLLSAI